MGLLGSNVSYDQAKIGVDAVMMDLKVVQELNTASQKGETVDLVKLHELVDRLDGMLDSITKTSVSAKMLGLGQIRRQMKHWAKDIEEREAKKGNVYVKSIPPASPPVI